MTRKILAICHSMGDSQAILSTANSLSSKKISTTVLVIGKTAKAKISEAIQQMKELETPYLDILDLDALCEGKPIESDSLSLSSIDLDQLIQTIENKNFNGLLVGTPSYVAADKQTLIPQQILSKLNLSIPSAVFSDYAFYDDKHTLSQNKWFDLATKFLVPFKKAIDSFKADADKTSVVGLPAIDNIKLKYAQWLNNEPKTTLEIGKKFAVAKLEVEHPFVFVAGGKAGDENLIEALAIACEEVPELKIYIGVHPAAENVYIETLQAIIEKKDKSKIMVILPKGVIETDEAVYLSQAVVSVSSTVSTTSTACGKLAAYFQEGKSSEDPTIPYIVSDLDNARLYSKKNELITFLKEAKETSCKIKAEQLVVQKSAADNIAEEVEKIMSHFKSS